MAEVGSFKYIDPDKAFCIHPNVLLAYLRYQGNAGEFERIMKEAKSGHNDEYDDYMRQVAEDRTLAQAILGWQWNYKK